MGGRADEIVSKSFDSTIDPRLRRSCILVVLLDLRYILGGCVQRSISFAEKYEVSGGSPAANG